MVFIPAVNQEISIHGSKYLFSMNPDCPGEVLRISGHKSVVYQLVNNLLEKFALKIYHFPYRNPGIVEFSNTVDRYSTLPGLSGCQRKVITPITHPELVTMHPELRYACLLPWINGLSWNQKKDFEQPLTLEQSWKAAYQLAKTLFTMENEGIAHCNLNDENLFLCPQPGGYKIEFTGLEQMYSSDLTRPDIIQISSRRYSHPKITDDIWIPEADRYSGGLLITEILSTVNLCQDIDQDRDRHTENTGDEDPQSVIPDISETLKTDWGETIARLFHECWVSTKDEACPSFEEWAQELLSLDNPDISNWVDDIEKMEDRTKWHIDTMQEYSNSLENTVIEIPNNAKFKPEEYLVDINAIKVLNDTITPQKLSHDIIVNSTPKKKPKENLFIFSMIFIVLAFMCIIVFIGGQAKISGDIISLGNVINPQVASSMLTANPTSSKADMTATSVVIQRFAATERANTIATSTAQANINATATAQIIAADIKIYEIGKKGIFGPQDVVLPHVVDDFVETYYLDPVSINFILEAEVQNPYDGSQNRWDFGVMFRHVGRNNEYRLAIESNRTWSLINRVDSNTTYVHEGKLKSLNLGSGLSNKIKLVVVGNSGYLYINNEYISTLDLSARKFAGNILVGTGFFSGNESEGAETVFKNISVWSISPSSVASTSQSEFCKDQVNSIYRNEHYLVKKWTEVYTYNVKFENSSGWEGDGYSMSLIPISEKSSPRCMVHQRVTPCTVMANYPNLLSCSNEARLNFGYYSTQQVSSIYCAFQVSLNHDDCGEILTYEYATTLRDK